MDGVRAAWAVEVAIIAARDLTGKSRRLPLPSELLATFIIFGGLAVVGGNAAARRPAAAVAWGLVVATAITSLSDLGVGPVTAGTGIGDTLAKVGDFLSGNTGAIPATQTSTAAPTTSSSTHVVGWTPLPSGTAGPPTPIFG